jgi:hypothetical protein
MEAGGGGRLMLGELRFTGKTAGINEDWNDVGFTILNALYFFRPSQTSACALL